MARLLALLAVAFAFALTTLLASPAVHAQPDDPQILVFSKTNGYRHASIPDGIAMLRELGAEHDFGVEASEDSTRFTDEGLAPYTAVVFLSTTGDVFNEEQQAAFKRYVRAGGGYVGIHAASDTEYDWPWYGEHVGAYFESHPEIQRAEVVVEDGAHPSTAMLPERWARTDEWYNYHDNPRGDVHVLLTLDESTYEGGTHGDDHPIAWCHEHDGGRVWYTGGGHTTESYSEPLFRQHVLGGLQWAMGEADGACGTATGE